MKSLFLVAVILSVIVPATAYGQTTVLNSTSTPNQCLDFNGDGTCEYIVLTNGTQIANPLTQPQPQQQVQNQNDGYKLWQRELDGVVYTDVTEYRHALEAKEEDVEIDESEFEDDNNSEDEGNGESWDDSCRDSGYRDGQNGPFEGGTYDHCGEEDGGDQAYYDGFIDGCMDADNSREVCEQATDAE